MSELAVQTPSQASAFFVLKITQGANKGDTYKITPPGVVIGSDREVCQVAVDDARVARQQCRIDFQPETITIEDLSGKSSTLVNQKPVVAPYALAHGDVISIGDTLLIFHTSGGPRATPTIPRPGAGQPFPLFNGGAPTASSAPPPISKNFMIFLAVAAIAVIGFLMMPADKKGKPPHVATSAQLNDAITAVQKRQEELQKPYINLTEQDLYNKRSAQKHFIRGKRDYEAGRYTRAIEAFQTTLATDPTHQMARRYYQLAEKKRQDMIDYHMDLGNKYKEKSMFKMCVAEFEKAQEILNQPTHKKYILAKEQIKECRLSLQETN